MTVTKKGGIPPAYSNAHFLAVLAEASARLSVVAAEDIQDSSGAKLIAKGQAVGVALQRRLAQRAGDLLKPIEASLVVKDGVTAGDLEQEAVRLCQGSAFLSAVVGGDFARLRRLYHSVPFHPFVTLLLSVQRAARPKLFSHSVLASVLAGVLVLREGEALVNAQLALLAGLLHDSGELYTNQNIADRIAGASRNQWWEVVAHVEAGGRVVEQFTDCPMSIVQAVREHHERIDGSGYLQGLSEQELSPLGRVLSVVETVCGVMNAPDNHGARAKLAVSFVTGEYDAKVVRMLVAPISGTFAAEIALPPGFDVAKALDQAQMMSGCLNAAHQAIAHLAQAKFADEQMAEVIAFAQHRIERLKKSWDATGIAEYFAADAARHARPEEDEESFFGLDVVTREIIWRMRNLARQIMFLLHQRRLTGYGGLEAVIVALEVES